MYRTTSLIKAGAVLLVFGTAIAAIAQRAGSSGTVVPICVKSNNGQLRVLTGTNAVCGPSEQNMEWRVDGEVTAIKFGPGLNGTREGA